MFLETAPRVHTLKPTKVTSHFKKKPKKPISLNYYHYYCITNKYNHVTIKPKCLENITRASRFLSPR